MPTRSFDEYLKNLGYDEKSAAPRSEAPPARSFLGEVFSTPTITPGRAPRYDEMGWQSKMGQGVAKGLATTATELGRLASHVVPEQLSDAVSNLPGARRMTEFADAPYEGGFERAGSYLTQAGTMLAGPAELRLGRLADQALQWTSLAPWARRGGNLAELAARGAAGGALASPDDPGTGAAVGAGTALAGPGLGAALRTGPGKAIARGALGAGTYGGIRALEHFGIPWGATVSALGAALGAPAAIHWYHSPLGIGRLFRIGDAFLDKFGRIIGRVQRGQLPGYASSSVTSNAFGPNAPPLPYNPFEPSTPPAPPVDPDATVQVR
jgi:hypothetical protein